MLKLPAPLFCHEQCVHWDGQYFIRALLPQCGIWFIVLSNLRGKLMRFFLSFIIALLLTLFVAGMSTGQRMDNCTHKDMQITHCTCAKHLAVVSAGAVHDSSVGQECCLSGECGDLPVAKDIALAPTSSPLEFSGTIDKMSFTPLAQRRITEFHRTDIFLPHLPATPIYNLHCSFLI